jgi:MFS family permease
VFRSHGRAIFTSLMVTWMLTATIVVVILMTPSLLPSLFGLAPHDVQMASLAGTAVLCLSTVLTGAATDRFGVRRVAIPVLLFLIAATYGLYVGAGRMPSALIELYALAGLGAGSVALTPIVMVRAFPAAIRFSGVSFSNNIAYAVFGGVTPLLVSWLGHIDRLSPAHYVAGVTVLGLVAILAAPVTQLADAGGLRE